MKRMIDESMKVLQGISKLMPITKEAIDVAVDTMDKYQKIEKIINAPNCATSAKYNAIVNLIKYSKVVEDENVDC